MKGGLTNLIKLTNRLDYPDWAKENRRFQKMNQ